MSKRDKIIVMEHTKNTQKSPLVIIALSVFLGVVVALLYLGFEWIASNGTNWLWNDVVQSDTNRLRVIPLALLMSVVYTIVIKLVSNKRIVKPETSLLDELDSIKKTSLFTVAVILLVGATSLIAGASLGPEAALVASCMGFAAWMSGKMNVLDKPMAFVLSISSIGALLAAFFNSLIPVVIPLIILKKKKKLNALSALVAIAAGVTSWYLIRVIKNEAYIEVPVSGTFNIKNLLLAGFLGFFSTLLALAIKWVIHLLFPPIENIGKKYPWIITASVFGLVLGILYFAGGQTVQFSGSEGLKLLSENPAQYGLAALLGLIVVKLLATSWSNITGYRGGLVFPSIYMGVVLSLAFSSIFSLTGATEAGTTIGAITGMLMGMINPIIGVILAAALFPLSQVFVVVGAVLGAFIGLKSTESLLPGVKK